jgi:hypothetical protein
VLQHRNLPLTTRAHAAVLLKNLYVIAYPYQCVTLPRYVRTFDALSSDVVLGDSATRALPSADRAFINDLFLLECFASSFFTDEVHQLKQGLAQADPDGEQLLALLSEQVEQSSGLEQLMPFQAGVLALMRAMADRGFISTFGALRDSLCKPLISVMDARSGMNEVRRRASITATQSGIDVGALFSPAAAMGGAEGRYVEAVAPAAAASVQCKVEACDTMLFVLMARLDYRMSKVRHRPPHFTAACPR